MLNTAVVGNVTQGQDTKRSLPISGAQHVQASCRLFQGFTAHAVCRERPCGGAQAVLCSGCSSWVGGVGGWGVRPLNRDLNGGEMQKWSKPEAMHSTV